MEQTKIRVFLLIAISFIGMLLYSKWQVANFEPAIPTTPSAQAQVNTDVPVAPNTNLVSNTVTTDISVADKDISSNLIKVETDVFSIEIDPRGGDIVKLDLNKYSKKLNSEEPFSLMGHSSGRYYIAQSGLLSDIGPDSRTGGRAILKTSKEKFNMNGNSRLQVPLAWNSNGIDVIKTYTFTENSYLIDVSYKITNNTNSAWQGRFYKQLKRKNDGKKNGFLGTTTYSGAAFYTADKPYKKVSFSDMEKSPFTQEIKGGWAAFVEHYFVSAWVPDAEKQNYYYSRYENDNYHIGAMGPLTMVKPGETVTLSSQLYAGPEITADLEAISPGLDLTVDYGFLWPISKFIFWVLKAINDVIGNWGWSIVMITLLIKVAFFKLSASSFKSMGNLRRIQPKINALRERYGDDRQKMSQELMALYKKEKINPLGGCLPILVQIPVFIALFYVLLESVELRQAPFMLWINDLSVKDPFYVLPLLMGATMFIQQKLNPSPPDPVQAKIMMAMPVVFTLLFMNFPSGLVLYWFVNNTLSILQQWYITNKITGNSRAAATT